MNKCSLNVLVLAFLSLCVPIDSHEKAPVIEAEIKAFAAHSSDETGGKIQPRTPMLLKVIVKNVGTVSTPPGEIFIRFALPSPLHQHLKSLLYASEKQVLPSLGAGQEMEIAFAKEHTWPGVFDFVREDWSLRSYEAVAKFKGREYVIGTMPIALSSAYYPGQSIRISTQIADENSFLAH